MVKAPLYNRSEREYEFNVYIVDDCGTGSSAIPVAFNMYRNEHPPVFQVCLSRAIG